MGAVFGNGDKPGVLGTGQQDIDVYDPNKDAYTLDQSAAKANNDARQAQIDARNAPTANAAQTDLNALYQAQLQNAQVAQSQGVKLAAAERVGNQNIGAANTSQNVNLGQAAQATAAQLNSQDAQFRNNQVALSNNLTNQMNGQGPSLAGTQYQQAAEKNLAAQAGMAAAGGGRNGNLAGRQLAANAAIQGQQTARDVANIRTQEQLNATGQLAAVSQQGRDQDINLAAQNAQLQQQAALANQGATNQFGLAQGQMNLQNQQFNAGALNSRQSEQAQLNQQSALANQAAGNQFALQQGQMSQQNNQFNSGAQNQAFLQNAQLQAQNQANYQAQYNQLLGQNTQNNQQTNLANQSASLQQQQLNDAMSQFYQGSNATLDARAQDAAMAYEQAQLASSTAETQAQQAAYEAARQGQSSITGGIIGAGVGMLSRFSDREVKTSVKRGNEKTKEFLDSIYTNGMMSSSPAGEKELAPPAPASSLYAQPVAPPVQQAPQQAPLAIQQAANPTSSVDNRTADSARETAAQSKARLEQENEKLTALMKGMQAAQAPGFAGSFAAGVNAGSGLASNWKAGQAAKAPQQSSAPQGSTQQAFSGQSDLGAGSGFAMNAVPAGQSSAFSGMQGSTGVSAPSPSVETSDINAKELSAVSHSPAGGKNLGAQSKMQQLPTMLRPNPAQEPQQIGKPQELSTQQKMLSGQPMTAPTNNIGMQMKNFGQAIGGANNGAQGITTYDKINKDGSMDVMGSLANHNAQSTAYAQPGGANNYSDNPGFGRVSAGGPGGSEGPTASVSDEKKKTDVKSGDPKVKDFLNTIHAYDYEYKEPEMPGRGQGRYVSPMAQELERTELGKSAVRETPEGKMVDYGKLLGTMLASQAMLNEEVNDLKGEKGKPPISKADKKKK